ncbi:MAG: hypothetical protein ACRC3Y_01000 [Romboutsia sp.]|uniref:hypothetical protein n=1 Tax=Romboutsia sp. TaxID=1965302 RepID=UPI003F2E6FD1
MFKILGVFFIVLGFILKTYSTYTLKNNKKLNNKKKAELEKSNQSGTTFIFAGLSALVLGLIM